MEKLIEYIKQQISCFKLEKSKAGASQIDKLSLGGRIAALEELLAVINVEQDNRSLTPEILTVAGWLNKVGKNSNTGFRKYFKPIEIKFRGKVQNVHDFRGNRIENGWVYGSLLQYPSLSQICDTEEMLGWSVDVIPESVGQFTGKYDKNKKEVYKGDILESAKNKYLVLWNEDTASFYAKILPLKGVECYSFLSENWADKKEIIGNMYDNPELLYN